MDGDGRDRWTLAAGVFGICVFAGLSQTAPGYRIGFFPPWTFSTPGELYLWLAHALVLVPSLLLLGWSLRRPLTPRLQACARWLAARSPAERRAGVFMLTALAFVFAYLGHFYILHDFPVTDDEFAAQFGGRILATGHVLTKLAVPPTALPQGFLFFRDGLVTSFDWPGIQLFWALAELSHLGTVLFALAAVAPVPAIAWVASRKFGAQWAVVAIGLYLLSPMVTALSLTTHAAVLSRAAIAWAIALYVHAEESPRSIGRWALFGLLVGLAALCRPPETAFFVLPMAVYALIGMVRGRLPAAPVILGALLGIALPLAVFLWHNAAVTGHAFLPARFAMLADAKRPMPDTLWTRFGANLGYNLFMLTVWFLGPLGILLVAFGAGASTFTRMLALCVVAQLVLALFHWDDGIHAVGPIHYSETPSALALVATAGLARSARWLERHNLSAWPLASPLALAAVLGLGTFSAIHLHALESQADGLDLVNQAIEAQVEAPAVVLVPMRARQVFDRIPGKAQVGTWVLHWRAPKPDLSDDVLLLLDGPDEKQLRALLPDRRFYRLTRLDQPPFIGVQPL